MIYCATLLKNAKYLDEFLAFYSQIVDGYIFLDNGSDDGTWERVIKHPKTLAAIQDLAPFSQETALRKKLFDLYKSKIPEEKSWVVLPDADEIFEEKFLDEVKNMIAQPNVNHYSFRFLHMWGCRTHYRVDGLWHPSQYGIRLYRLDKTKTYSWPNVPFACGSAPWSILKERGVRSDIFIKHLGYADPEDINKKFILYSKKETMPYHQRQHIVSIMQRPTLKEYVPASSKAEPIRPVILPPFAESELPPVTIGCPIRDRDWIVRDHFDALDSLEYPKNLISFLYILNDSTDKTKEILEEIKKEKENQYRSFLILEKNFNRPPDARIVPLRQQYTFHTLTDVRNMWLNSIAPENWALSVDSDILVATNTLKKLINNRKDICSAFISNETIPRTIERTRGNILKFISPARTRCWHVKAKPLGAVIPIDVTGAVYLLSPKVVSSIRFSADRQGEDIGFCRSALNQGIQPYCDTRLIPVHAMQKDRYLELRQNGPVNSKTYNFVNFPSAVNVPS